MAPASVIFLIVGLIVFLASGCTCPRMTEASVYVSLFTIVSIFFLQRNNLRKESLGAEVRNCTDLPSPQMLEQGILVCRGYDAFSRLCSKSTAWSKNWYCDKSCQEAGYGYPDSACIPPERVQKPDAPKGFVHNLRAWADTWAEKYRWLRQTVRDLKLSSSRAFVTFALATLVLGGVFVFRSTVGLEALFYCILITIAVITYSPSRGYDAGIAADTRSHTASTPGMDRDARDSIFFDVQKCTDCFKDLAMPADTLDWTLARQDTEFLKVIGENDVGMTLKDEQHQHRALRFIDLKRFCDNKRRGSEVHFLPVALNILFFFFACISPLYPRLLRTEFMIYFLSFSKITDISSRAS